MRSPADAPRISDISVSLVSVSPSVNTLAFIYLTSTFFSQSEYYRYELSCLSHFNRSLGIPGLSLASLKLHQHNAKHLLPPNLTELLPSLQ